MTQVAADTSTPPAVPSELCGYPVASALSSSGSTYLAIGPGGRGVVLKKMDDDCLLRGQLHPSIRERLGRVRELAHGGVANLYGVGRDGAAAGDASDNNGSSIDADVGAQAGAQPGAHPGRNSAPGQAWLIWEYVEGQSFSDYAAAPGRSLRDLAAAGRELALALDLLHMQGIVHGAITDGNVIVSPSGNVRLTHVSPLLYTDPVPDAEAVVHLLQSAVAARGEAESPLGTLLAAARAEALGLRPLAARLAALIESRELDDFAAAQLHDDAPRRRARYAAAVVALLGIAAGVAAWRSAGSPGLRAKVQQWMGQR